MDTHARTCARIHTHTHILVLFIHNRARSRHPRPSCGQVPAQTSTHAWLVDFAERAKQFQRLSTHAANGENLRCAPVWLGGLFVPEAFFTATRQAATRQAAAHDQAWSLEQLRMELDVLPRTTTLDDASFKLIDLRFEGATCAGDVLALTHDMVTVPGTTVLRWVHAPEGSKYKDTERVELPIYLNSTRANLLLTVDLRASPGVTQHTFYERGVAIICSALGN